ncbi:phage repressor [bacterium endosymbiont of Mortierella elongata FMR23-6]|nr:phage repressor [bacterium endosymbiont of Mortierella elongata FMR23-6]
MLKLMENLKDENNAATNVAFLAPLVKKMKEVLVIGTVEGATDGSLKEMRPTEDFSNLVIEYPGRGKDVYALRIKGEAMRPRIRSGEFIIVEPFTEPRSADDVIVIFDDGKKMLRELLYVRDGDVTLGPINGNSVPISIPTKDLKLQYVAAIIPRGKAYKAE